MRIVVRKTYAHEWSAIDADTYEGITSPVGLGNSPAEAEDDLMRQIEELKPDSHENL